MKLQFCFLRNCQQECVIPNTLLSRRLQNIYKGKYGELENLIISQHISQTRKEIKQQFKTVEKLKSDLKVITHAHQLKFIFDYVYNCLRRRLHLVKETHKKKLNKLIVKSNEEWKEFGNTNNIINLSKKVLSENEECVLKLGMKFNTASKKPDIVKIEKEFIRKSRNQDIDQNLLIAKGIIYGNYVSTSNSNYFPVRFSKAIKNLKNDSKIRILEADKSKTFVILNTEDYILKMNQLLSDNDIYEKLKSNPLERVNATYNKRIREIFEGNHDTIKQLKSIGASLPYLYGKIKTHKLNNPCRPVISTVGSAAYRLSKHLTNLLQPLVGNISNSNIINNVDFINKIENIKPREDQIMVSFDVKSLFTNVPIEDALDYLKQELNKYVYTIPIYKILDLIRLCTVDTCFIFEDVYYRQKFGMQMGSCLSPVMANIYMEFFETRKLNLILPENTLWLRFVDDTFSIWNKDNNLNVFLDELNNQVPSIKFTCEVEKEKTIPFLDVNVLRTDDGFKFKVYRKPTNNNLIISSESRHTKSIKISAIRSNFLRALRVCSDEFIEEEFRVINEIAKQHNFSTYDIDEGLKLAKETFYKEKKNNNINLKSIICLPYHPVFEQAIHPLKTLGYKLVFSYTSTLKKILIRNSPKQNEGIIYNIPCGCNKYYIGQTCKSMNIRSQQHQYCIAKQDIRSAIYLHSEQCDRPIMFNEAATLFRNNNYVERNIIESACIKLTKDSNFNTHPGLYTLDNMFIHLFEQQYKLRNLIM
jgi:hypothetical protein